jgi:putative oxidoreductase
MQIFALPLARILLSLVFIWGGYTKVFGFGGMNMQGWIAAVKGLRIPGTSDPLPNPELLAQIAAYGELVGGIMLFIGILTRVTALGLLLFVIAASVLGHAFWAIGTADPAAAKMFMEQLGSFLKNMGLVGGLLLLVGAGGGALSIDGMFRRPH